MVDGECLCLPRVLCPTATNRMTCEDRSDHVTHLLESSPAGPLPARRCSKCKLGGVSVSRAPGALTAADPRHPGHTAGEPCRDTELRPLKGAVGDSEKRQAVRKPCA